MSGATDKDTTVTRNRSSLPTARNGQSVQTIDRVLLRSTLSRIVPMWIATLKAEPWLYVEHRIHNALADDITFDRQLARCAAEQSIASQMAEFYRLGESVAC